MKLHICAPDIFAGDAVGNHCMGMANMAATLGFSVRKYAQRFDASIPNTHPVEDLFGEVEPDDHLFVNFSIYDPFLERLAHLNLKKICYFHGVTPPELLSRFEPETAKLCSMAIDQIHMLSKFDQVIVNSKYTANTLLSHANLKKVTVLPPVFSDMPVFKRSPSRKQDKRASSIEILVVGRVVQHKSIEDVFNVLSVIRGKGIEATLTVAGSLPCLEYSKFLFNHAKALGMLDFITFTGSLDNEDLFDCYDNANCLLSMSHHEGFCVPVLEAMHFGLPVFVRKGTASEEVVANLGFLFDGNDPNAIGSLIVDSLYDPEKIANKLDLAKKRVKCLLNENSPEVWRAIFQPALSR